MRERLQDMWDFVSNITLGIIGAYAGRNAARRVLKGWFRHLDVQNNVEDMELYLEANNQTGADYCEFLLDNPDFRLWSYRQVRNVWENLLWFNLTVLYRERMEGAS